MEGRNQEQRTVILSFELNEVDKEEDQHTQDNEEEPENIEKDVNHEGVSMRNDQLHSEVPMDDPHSTQRELGEEERKTNL